MKNKIFAENPSLDCYFQTSDGQCFFTESAAKLHAKTLKDTAVTPHHRSSLTDRFEDIEDINDTDDINDIDVDVDVDEQEEEDEDSLDDDQSNLTGAFGALLETDQNLEAGNLDAVEKETIQEDNTLQATGEIKESAESKDVAHLHENAQEPAKETEALNTASDSPAAKPAATATRGKNQNK